MSYVLISTDDFHRGPTRISTIDPYLHEKVPFTVIKDSLYFQVKKKWNKIYDHIGGMNDYDNIFFCFVFHCIGYG